MKHCFLTALTCLACLLGAPALAELVPVWSTGVAVPGEKVVLYLVDTEIEADDSIFIQNQPRVSQAAVRMLQPCTISNPLDPQRGVAAVAPILFTPDSPGELAPGSIEVNYRSGKAVTVDVPPLPVQPTSAITWYDSPVPYGALWYVDTKDGYVNQPVKAALKLFIPENLVVPHMPGIKPMGVSVAYFQPALHGLVAIAHREEFPRPVAYAKGGTWRTVDFIGEFTPFREGQQGVGISVTLAQPVRFRGVVQQTVPLPTLTLSALPLPPGAPADFANTVGQYSISATTTAQDLAMHEPVEVEITVRGTGNLANLECPSPVDATDWKLVPATRKPLLDGNGQTVGMVFSQLMRPTAEVGGIPAFSFSYFDPQAMEYRRAETRPIPLTWRMTAEAGSGLQTITTTAPPPPAGEVPVEEMRDIYGFLMPTGGLSLNLPRWLWYLLYLPAVLILLALAIGRLRRVLASGAAGRARERELAQVAHLNSGLAFLKALGGFIEANIPPAEQTPELRAILTRRDEEAFRPEASVSLSPAEKNNMLKLVRRTLAKLATVVLLLLCLAPGTQAQDVDTLAEAERAYHAAQYSESRAFLQSKPATHAQEAAHIWYNMGNCLYRLNQPGQAALYYARALWADPGMKEARLNLQFVQRQQGAILPIHEGANALFTFLTPQQLWVGTIAATALLALCLALQLAWRGHYRPWLHTVTSFALLLSLACAINWLWYLTRETPDFALLPPRNLAYVVTEGSARSAADEKGAEVIRLTPSTPLRLLARRGSWSYVETATGTRGWAPTSILAPLCPEGMEPRLPLSLHF